MNVAWLFLVAFFWGTSNPLMKRVTASGPSNSVENKNPLMHMLSLFKRWRFLAAYAYDQMGSVLYYYLLGSVDLSIAVPITNALTFAIAGVTEALVDKRLPSRATAEGTVLILIGVYICVNSKP